MNNILRKLLELYFREKVVKRYLIMNDKKIPIYLTPDSQLKYLKSDIDPELKEFVRKYVNKNDVIWDIGANCGSFGFYSYLKEAKEIVFVEPDLFLVNLIEKTKNKLLNKQKFHILANAVSDKFSTNKFYIAKRGRASNALSISGRDQMGGIRQINNTPTITLENICQLTNTVPDIIKIDIEGAEKLALKKLKNFNKIRPKIFLIETESNTLKSIKRIMKNIGYSGKETWNNNFIFVDDNICVG